MKKSQSSLLVACLLTLALPVQAQDELNTATEATFTPTENNSHAFFPFTGAIKGSKVRMRVQPSLEGHVVRETVNGEMFIIVGETNDYYAVLPPKETKGFIFRTFILDGAVEGERVNVRLYPDIDAPVIGQLNTGDRVDATVSDVNSKWLEISLPETSRFYVAKEYVENKGPAQLLLTLEKKRAEAAHLFSAASLYAQAEFQKPFNLIDLDPVYEKFQQITQEYADVPAIVEQVQELTTVLQEAYVQKKLAFLESKTSSLPSSSTELNSEILAKLSKLGIEIRSPVESVPNSEVASMDAKMENFASAVATYDITDKMLAWQPLEESLYHSWAATHCEQSIQEFYAMEQQEATLLTGMIEPYLRPVKNRPGDFLLRNEGLPVAFLYSTSVNLEKFVGQKVSLLVAPRPNHNFAFPAYFVISVE